MTEIYIVRHGQTDSNIRSACLGVKDIPLNETGIKQSKELCARIGSIDFDVIYSSPLSRAMETIAPYIKSKKGMAVHMSYGLTERNFGIWDDMTFDEIKNLYPQLYGEWMKDFIGFKIPKGESSAEVQERVNNVLDKIIVQHDGEKILIVTHLGTARHIISHLLGLETEQGWRFFIDNASFAKVRIENGKGLLTVLNG